MLAKTLKRAGIGFLISVVVGNLIAFLSGTSPAGEVHLFSKQLLSITGGNEIAATVLQSLFSGLYGALCFAGMSFYEIERMPLAAATASHCALIVLAFIPISYLLGWVGGLVETLIIAAIQAAAFFVIWLILYSVYKKQVRELNDLQKTITEYNSKTKGNNG